MITAESRLAPFAKRLRKSKEQSHSDYFTAGAFLFPLGLALLCWANESFGPVVFGLAFVAIAIVIAKLLSKALPRATGLSDGVFAALSVTLTASGATQLYALFFSGNLQNTTDAVQVFYPLSRIGLANGAFQTLGTNSDFAIGIWQVIYEIAAMGNLGDGPWIGVSFNCFVTSLAIAFVLATAELVRSSCGEVRDIGPWIVYSPLLWMTSCLHLRDVFTVLSSSVLMFLSAYLIFKPSLTRFFLISLLMSIAVVFTAMVRVESAFMLGAIAFCGLACATLFGKWKSADTGRAFTLVLLVLLAVGLLGFAIAGRDRFFTRSEHLLDDNSVNGEEGSLGTRWVYQAILPVRLLLGSYYMFVHPVPLWGYIGPQFEEFFWLESLGGYVLAVMWPFIIDGTAAKVAIARGAVLKKFLVVSSVMGLGGVVLTTLDPRHMVQFFPFLVILMSYSVPSRSKARLKTLSSIWIGSVCAAHLVWAVLKFR